MCGRLNLRLTSLELSEFFDLFSCPSITPRYNIAPLQQVLAIRQTPTGRAADFLRWGLIPSWATDATRAAQLINARSETVRTLPSFRAAFRERRCLVPVTGYYEWQRLSPRTTQPWHFCSSTLPALALAGLWEIWRDADGQSLETLTILTTTANAAVNDVHDRMPVILPAEAWTPWLTADDAVDQWLTPCPAAWLQRDAVSSRVNSPKFDDPQCLAPIAPQKSLFD